MDLYVLDPISYQPSYLIEGYDSLIWTERYAPAGSFELITSLVDETRMHLPEGTLVAIRESQEIMFVETHEVSIDADSVTKLKTSGRTFETALEHRAMVVNDDPISPDYSNAYPGVYLEHLINDKLGSTASLSEAIPNVVGLDDSFIYVDLPDEPFPDPKPGDVYSLVYENLVKYRLGIRNIRPPGALDEVVYMMIYYGRDRTVDPDPLTAAPEVVFHFSVGDILDYSYLSSIRDYKNVAYVYSPLGFQIVYGPGVDPGISGLDRRILQVDANDLTDAGNIDDVAAIYYRGITELASHNKVSLLDGEISPNSQYKYGINYYLGDKVTVLGKEGVAQSRRVTEFIRSENIDGEKGWPTLSEVEVDVPPFDPPGD